jgi:hypothetical protein
VSASVCVPAGLVGLLLLGCVNQNTWTPTIDPYGDPNAARITQDEVECRQLAQQASGGSMRKTAEGVGIGGAIGAAAGAALGAVMGSPGAGAALGATIGGFGGGMSEGSKSNQSFQSAFDECMTHRGHKVLSRASRSGDGSGAS